MTNLTISSVYHCITLHNLAISALSSVIQLITFRVN